MRIRTALGANQVAGIVAAVGRETYGGNLRCEARQISRGVVNLKVDAVSSRGPGARRSASGRRGPWACWHAFRDVLAAVYLEDPAATVRTALEAYGDARGFLESFPATSDRNVGTMLEWVCMPDLCDCEELGGRDFDDTARDYVAELWREVRRRDDVETIGTLLAPMGTI